MSGFLADDESQKLINKPIIVRSLSLIQSIPIQSEIHLDSIG